MALTNKAKGAVSDLLNIKKFIAGTAGLQRERLASMDPEAYAELHGIRFASYKGSVNAAGAFRQKAEDVVNNINNILSERISDPTKEPVFVPSSPDEERRFAKANFLTTSYVDPARFEARSPFRLSFGPPKSQSGFYLLTSDGLYYDGQKGGLDPINTYIEYTDTIDAGDEYLFQHAPNLGGRGLSFSLKESFNLVGELFDIDKIDDGLEMQKWYTADTFLRTLLGNRNKQVSDVSSLMTSSTEVGEPSAVLFNLRNEFEGIVSRWEQLIRKRKKQIEIAVKAPLLYGRHVLVTPLPPAPVGGGADTPTSQGGQGQLVFIYKDAVDAGRGPQYTVYDYYDGPYHAMPGDRLHTGAQHSSDSKEIVPFHVYGQILPIGGGYGGPGDTVPGSDTGTNCWLPDGTWDESNPQCGTLDTGPRTFVRVPFATKPLLSFDASSIPINDFSWISNLNFSVEILKQKSLFFDVGDVEGMVLPVQTKFTTVQPRTTAQNIQHLYTAPIGLGGIIYTTSGGAPTLSLTDSVPTEGLIAIYNFLETEVDIPRDWWKFNTLNSVTPDNQGNASLISLSPTSVFRAGVGIPYLKGICGELAADAGGDILSIGSFLQLPPENSYHFGQPETQNDPSEFVDWTYNSRGFSFDCWVKVPDLTSESAWGALGTSSLTKCILSCENTGVASGASSLYQDYTIDTLPNVRNGDVHRGFSIGFTRDRRLATGGAAHSDVMAENPISNLAFFVAPTTSKNASACSWINKTANTGSISFDWHKCIVPTSKSVNGAAFQNAASQFMHVAITADPPNDTLNIYCDGELMTTSSVSDTFGTEPYHAINLPSFRHNNSFEYRPPSNDYSSHDQNDGYADPELPSNPTNGVKGPVELYAGPRLTRFTPFIIGSGYTDGASFIGNFMGDGSTGGKTSALNGYIGSLKLYNRPLNTNEVKTTYESQKGFFKTIITD
tara:strand:- start:9519 stop:12359 length:2841 start_codon:yes stop_codon:yes gene_type:complete